MEGARSIWLSWKFLVIVAVAVTSSQGNKHLTLSNFLLGVRTRLVPTPTPSRETFVLKLSNKTCFNNALQYLQSHDWKLAKFNGSAKFIQSRSIRSIISNRTLNPIVLRSAQKHQDNNEIIMLHKEWSNSEDEIYTVNAYNFYMKSSRSSNNFCSSDTAKTMNKSEVQYWCRNCEPTINQNYSVVNLNTHDPDKYLNLSISSSQLLDEILFNAVKHINFSVRAHQQERSIPDVNSSTYDNLSDDRKSSWTISRIIATLKGRGCVSVCFSLLEKLEELADFGFDLERQTFHEQLWNVFRSSRVASQTTNYSSTILTGTFLNIQDLNLTKISADNGWLRFKRIDKKNNRMLPWDMVGYLDSVLKLMAKYEPSNVDLESSQFQAAIRTFLLSEHSEMLRYHDEQIDTTKDFFDGVAGPRIIETVQTLDRVLEGTIRKLRNTETANASVDAMNRLKDAASACMVTNTMFKFLISIGGFLSELPELLIQAERVYIQFESNTGTPAELLGEITRAVSALRLRFEQLHLKHSKLNEKLNNMMDSICNTIKVALDHLPQSKEKESILKALEARMKIRSSIVHDQSSLEDVTANVLNLVEILHRSQQQTVDTNPASANITQSASATNYFQSLCLVSPIDVGQAFITAGIDTNLDNNVIDSVEKHTEELLKLNQQHRREVNLFRKNFYVRAHAVLSTVQNALNKFASGDFSAKNITQAASLQIISFDNMRVWMETFYTWFQVDENDRHQLRSIFENAGVILTRLAELLDDNNNIAWTTEELFISEQLGASNETFQRRKVEVLLLHERWTTAFYNYIFPFRQLVISEFSLPENIVKENVSSIARSSMSLLTNLLKNFELIKIQISPSVDPFQQTTEFEDNEFFPPICSWGQDYSSDFSRMLEGELVTLVSDILNSDPERHALKFDFIDLSFAIPTSSNCALGTKQLRMALEKYQVEMIHSGTSYYRYGNNFYKTQSERLELRFSLSKGKDGKPRSMNKAYAMLLNRDLRASPFTSWSFRLTPVRAGIGYAPLQPFLNCSLELSLTGAGTYYRPELAFASNIELNLDSFYVSEDTLRRIEVARLNPLPPLSGGMAMWGHRINNW